MDTWGKPFSVQKAIVWLDGSRTRSPISKGTPQSQDAQCSDWRLELDRKDWHGAGEKNSEQETGPRQGAGLLVPSPTSSNLSRAFNSEK